MKDTTRTQIIAAFENFDKWTTYGIAFDLMTQRKVRLSDIQEIAEEVAQIAPDVIAMRRRDYLAMSGGLEAARSRLQEVA